MRATNRRVQINSGERWFRLVPMGGREEGESSADMDCMRIDKKTIGKVGQGLKPNVGEKYGEDSQPSLLMRVVESSTTNGMNILDKDGVVAENPTMGVEDIEGGLIVTYKKRRRIDQMAQLLGGELAHALSLNQLSNLLQKTAWWVLGTRLGLATTTKKLGYGSTILAG